MMLALSRFWRFLSLTVFVLMTGSLLAACTVRVTTIESGRSTTATKKSPAKPQQIAKNNPNKPLTWNGLPVGEMHVRDETVLVTRVQNGTPGAYDAWQKLKQASENEGVLIIHTDKKNICDATASTPLSSAYLDDDGTIVNITNMRAYSKGDCSAHPVNSVLIMPYLWFSLNDIKAGDKFSAFQPVTAERKTHILSQLDTTSTTRKQLQAQRKEEAEKRIAEEEKQRAEQKKIEEQKLAAQRKAEEEKQAYAQMASVLRRMLERGKPDVSVADMREVTLGSGSLLVFQGTKSFPLLPNEAFLLSSPTKMNVYGDKRERFQPLSFAYMGEDGRIVRLDSVKAYYPNDYQIDNKEKAAYVLVASFGWFDKHGVTIGDMVSFKPMTDKRHDALNAQGKTVLAQMNKESKAASIAAAQAGSIHPDSLLQAGKGYHYSYVCAKEEAQSLFYVQSRGEDGSINAIYDLLIPDFNKNTVSNVRVQMKGNQNTEGVYTFVPIKVLKNAPGYKVNSIRAWGNLDELDVNLSGSACGSAEQLGVWNKTPDDFIAVKENADFNVTHRPLHLAEIYYDEKPDDDRKLVKRRDIGLGLMLAVADAAPPGDIAKTSILLRAGNKGIRNGSRVSSCAGMDGISPCLSSKEGTNVFELGRIKAAHSQKVSWTPLDFAPQHELAWYEIVPGQRWVWVNKGWGSGYYKNDPEANQDASSIHMHYRHARYAYLQSQIKRQERVAEFRKYYTLSVEKKEIKKVGGVKQSGIGNVDGARTLGDVLEGGLSGLGGANSAEVCADYSYTVSIKPKNAASRKPFAVDINWQLDQHRLNNGRAEVSTRNIALHHKLDAKNNYSYKKRLTFQCVTQALDSKTRVLFFKSQTQIELKKVKFGPNVVRVYD